MDTPTNAVSRKENLLARLDVMPVTPHIRRIAFILVLAWFIEAFDIGLTGGLIVTLKQAWGLSSAQAGLIGISETVSIVIALVPAGRLADVFGRKTLLMWGVAIFTVATLLSGLSWNLASLLIFRFIAGLGAGAMFPLPYLLMSEYVNRHKRTTFVGWGELVLKLGYTVPSLVAIWAISTFDAGTAWRVPLIAAGITVVIVPLLKFGIPESPRYLLRKGRENEVQDFVESLEREANIPHDETLSNPELKHVPNSAMSASHANAFELLKQPYFGRSIIAYTALLSPFVLWYPMLNYAPSIFKGMGASKTQGLLFIAAMMGVAGIGSVAMGRLGDRIGRKRTHVTFILLAAIGLVIMGQNKLLPLWVTVIAATMVSLFGFGNFVVPKVYLSEQYPTRLRGVGTATGEMTVRLLAGVVLAYFIPTLLVTVGPSVLFVFLAVAMVVLILPMVFFGRETAGRSLETADPRLAADGIPDYSPLSSIGERSVRT